VHICYGYGIQPTSTGEEPRTSGAVREIFPALAKSKITRFARVHPFEGADRAPQAAQGKDVLIASSTSRATRWKPPPSGRHHRPGGEYVPKKHPPLHQLRHGADGPQIRAAELEALVAGTRLAREKAQIEARHGMVACARTRASEAGVAVRAGRLGGRCRDRGGVALAPSSAHVRHRRRPSGLIYDASQRQVSYLDGGGRAAASATLARLQAKGKFRPRPSFRQR